jgi:hypothetical protein
VTGDNIHLLPAQEGTNKEGCGGLVMSDSCGFVSFSECQEVTPFIRICFLLHNPVGPCTAGMFNFKQVVIDFLVSKLPVIYHPSYRRTSLSAKILVKITRHMMFVVKATYIESTDYFNTYFPFKI